MVQLSAIERAAVEAAGAAPMLAQVEAWALVNSGSRNLGGLATVAGLLGEAFAVLPGELVMLDPAPVDAPRARRPRRRGGFRTHRRRAGDGRAVCE